MGIGRIAYGMADESPGVTRKEWQQDRDKAFAEARLDLVNAMAEYPDAVAMYVMAEYLRNASRERASAGFVAEDNND